MSEAPTGHSLGLSRAARSRVLSPVFLAILAGACALSWVILIVFREAPRVAGADPAQVPAVAAAVEKRSSNDFECRWTDVPITVDGAADEVAWAQAQPIARFYLPWLGADARDAKTATLAKLLWDREYLYFVAEMEDRDLHAPIAEHDGKLWENDVFELFFKPAKGHRPEDKSGYYEFQVNPANARLDMFLPSRDSGGYTRHKSEGEFDYKTAVKLRGTLNRRDDRDQGWTVEGRIAWKSLLRTGGRPEPGETWTFALCRVDDSIVGSAVRTTPQTVRTADPATAELSTSAPLVGEGRPDFHRVDQYAPIVFVGPDAPKTAGSSDGPRPTLPPLTTSRVAGSPEPPPSHRIVNAYPKLKLNYPIAMDRQPHSDRMLAITEAGAYGATKIVRFVDDPGAGTFEVLLDLDAVAYDFAFHPQFERNGFVYIGLNGPLSKQNRKTQVVRYTMSPRPPYALDPKSALVMIDWESEGHNGGAIDFGPDGMLYVTSGDGSNDSDTWLSGQDLSRLLAKVLRIDVDRPEAGKMYSVPRDNPFVGQKGIRPETWAYGLRNPWRMEFDRKTGQLWVTQNGQDHFEQVYLVEKGANYGWSAMEGSHPFYPDRRRGPRQITVPTAEHAHSEARSLTGGIVHHGSTVPELHGAYIYGDYSTGKIWGIRHDGGKVTWNREIADTALRITGFGTNARGELLVLDHVKDGGIYRLERNSAPATAAMAFPKTLSKSGLFKSVKSHVMQDGVQPYSVNAELWSDGAHKERFLAIPGKSGQERKINYAGKWAFELPEETVLVKSFALEAEAGNPASRKWVETRFLTKQQGEWVGYSYAWNDDGTDATLVEARGRDREYMIRDAKAAGGVRKQTWHYPSRTECMVCHSRAANFVLGLTEVQLNKDHDYGGGRVENQLRVLERLGLLRMDYRNDAINEVRADGRKKGLSNAKLDEYVRRQTEAANQRQVSTSQLFFKDPVGRPKLVNPYDPAANIDARARSYLHANCAMCHVEAGGGNAAIDLEFFTALDKTRALDVTPLHATFDLKNPRLIAPGDSDRSVLLHRMKIRGSGQMPPLASGVVDEQGVDLMRKWIAQIKKPGRDQRAGGKE